MRGSQAFDLAGGFVEDIGDLVGGGLVETAAGAVARKVRRVAAASLVAYTCIIAPHAALVSLIASVAIAYNVIGQVYS